ncbi:unnamed protein product [Closterium sp. NIES-54]
MFLGLVGVLCHQSEGLGFESQCVHFGYPSAGGCQRSTGDPRLILGKGYKLVVLGAVPPCRVAPPGAEPCLPAEPRHPTELRRPAEPRRPT